MVGSLAGVALVIWVDLDAYEAELVVFLLLFLIASQHGNDRRT